jgi:hypothetical protein
MKNVTVTLPEEVAKWARVEAAKREQSVSSYIAELLQAQMEHEPQYSAAMSSYFAAEPADISGGSPYPDRNAIHER